MLQPHIFIPQCTVQVGYLLGLGDRHPSNLMLDRYSGKLLHIDFGDCFEASMHREKFPEKARPPALGAAACMLAASCSPTMPWLSPHNMAEQCSRQCSLCSALQHACLPQAFYRLRLG